MSTDKPERSMPDLRGQVISGRYRVIDCIGQGALGQVYAVEHVAVGRRFALKLLKQEHRGTDVIRERFRQEAKLGGRLDSPHIVKVIDYDTWHDAPYLVMEYLEGATLQALLLREAPLPVARAARLMMDACRGVAAAHALGVLHRDLKPSNLFVCREGGVEVCKILDLGVAKASDALLSTSLLPSTTTGAIVGTLAYMAPEQLRAASDLDARADVYALGAILYECLSGRRVFEAPTPPALMYRILEETPRSLAGLRPELPPELVACVHRALARDRDERFATARDLERALARFTWGEPVAERPAPADETRPGDTPPERQPAPEPTLVLGPARPRRAALVWGAVLVATALGMIAGRRFGGAEDRPRTSAARDAATRARAPVEPPPATHDTPTVEPPAATREGAAPSDTREPATPLASEREPSASTAAPPAPAASPPAPSPPTSPRPRGTSEQKPARPASGNAPSATPPKPKPSDAPDFDDINPYRGD